MQQNMVKFLGFTTASFLFLGLNLNIAAHADAPTSDVAALQASIDELGAKKQTLQAAALQSTNNAVVALYEKNEATTALAEAENAVFVDSESFAEAKETVGFLFGEMYRSSTSHPILEVMLDGTEVLHGNVVASKVNEAFDEDLRKALTQQQASKALLGNLENKQKLLDESVLDSQKALANAETLLDDQNRLQKQLENELDAVLQKLAVLRETSLAEEKQLQADREETRQRELFAQQIKDAPPSYEEVKQSPVYEAPPSYEEVKQSPVYDVPVKQEEPTQVAPEQPVAGVGYAGQVLAFAQAQIGKPYLWGGVGPVGFDCSGLVQASFASAGKSTPRVAAAQYFASTKISLAELQQGDLVFWTGTGNPADIYHVAIYIGNDRVIHAPQPGMNVEEMGIYAMGPNVLTGRA